METMPVSFDHLKDPPLKIFGWALKNREFWNRFLITCLILGATIVAESISLPNLRIDHLKIKEWLNFFSGFGAVPNLFSITALGVAPFYCACIIMQIVCGIVPKWRTLIYDGGLSRQKLYRGTLVLSLFLIMLMSVPMARGLITQGLLMDDSLSTYAMTTLTLAGGAGFLLLAAFMLNRWGIGNGFAWLFLVHFFSGIYERACSYVIERSVPDIVLLFFVFVIVMVFAWFVTTLFVPITVKTPKGLLILPVR